MFVRLNFIHSFMRQNARLVNDMHILAIQLITDLRQIAKLSAAGSERTAPLDKHHSKLVHLKSIWQSHAANSRKNIQSAGIRSNFVKDLFEKMKLANGQNLLQGSLSSLDLLNQIFGDADGEPKVGDDELALDSSIYYNTNVTFNWCDDSDDD